MNTKQLLLAAISIGALVQPACTHRIADLTFASTKIVDMNDPKGFTTTVNARVKGRDTRHFVIFFPVNGFSPKEAMDRAIEKNGSSCIGLTNMKLEYGWWYIPYIYGQEWFEVTGDPVYKR